MLFQPRQHLFVSVRASSRFKTYANCSEFIKKNEWPQTLQIWIHWTARLEKYHKLQPKSKKTDELKVALQTIWEELPEEHIKKTVAKFHQALICLHGCGYQWWSLQASAVSLSISKSASSSHHQQTGSFHSHQQTTCTPQNAEK